MLNSECLILHTFDASPIIIPPNLIGKTSQFVDVHLGENFRLGGELIRKSPRLAYGPAVRL